MIDIKKRTIKRIKLNSSFTEIRDFAQTRLFSLLEYYKKTELSYSYVFSEMSEIFSGTRWDYFLIPLRMGRLNGKNEVLKHLYDCYLNLTGFRMPKDKYPARRKAVKKVTVALKGKQRREVVREPIFEDIRK